MSSMDQARHDAVAACRVAYPLAWDDTVSRAAEYEERCPAYGAHVHIRRIRQCEVRHDARV